MTTPTDKIKEFKERKEKEFDEKFPRLIISINESTWGDRAERVEGSGEIMKAYISRSQKELLELVEGMKPKPSNREAYEENPEFEEGFEAGVRAMSIIIHNVKEGI